MAEADRGLNAHVGPEAGLIATILAHRLQTFRFTKSPRGSDWINPGR